MLSNLKPLPGSTKPRKRVGRGHGSGHGKTAGKGHKGQLARSGGKTRVGFEGGQMPLYQRLPKRGFNNHTKKEYAIVNLSSLNEFDNDSVVSPKVLINKKIVRKQLDGIKVLGNGKLEKKLTVKAHQFSKSAKEAIEALGGTVEVI
ncbi:MAG: 50S ribosomal protein L15 [Acholeplasmataceae bacterium]